MRACPRAQKPGQPTCRNSMPHSLCRCFLWAPSFGLHELRCWILGACKHPHASSRPTFGEWCPHLPGAGCTVASAPEPPGPASRIGDSSGFTLTVETACSWTDLRSSPRANKPVVACSNTAEDGAACPGMVAMDDWGAERGEPHLHRWRSWDRESDRDRDATHWCG